jgi:threonine dehydrogenase-like Zn-dependent dehydrogenase
MAVELQRTAVLSAPRLTQIVSTQLRAPAADEVRVRLQGCGICASNLAVWEGRPWFQYPRAAGSPGHEGWGRIDALGSEVRDLEVGQRVALISGHAYAEYDTAPRNAVVKLAPELDALPFPGEALACAMNIFERSEISAGQHVAIVGGGFLGLLLTQLAARTGAKVVVLSRRQFALEQARQRGASETIAIRELRGTVEQSKHLRGAGFERVIEAVGVQSTLDLASELTAERGRLIIAGYHQDGPRQVDMQQWNWRGLDVINAHERSLARYVSGVQRAMDAILAGLLDPFPLLTHQVPLAELDRGFALTRSRPDGFIKALMMVEPRA